MDYEKKYLKYKSKYNLKKSSLLGGEAIMTGGNIDAIADLVFRDVPMISRQELLGVVPEILAGVKPMYDTIILSGQKGTYEQTLQNQYIVISPLWTRYVEFKTIEPHNGYKYYKLSFKENIEPNARPVNPDKKIDGKTLLYLAAQNCNKQMFDALVAMGANVYDINRTSHSNILHGIAWGKVNEQGQPIKTYDEKVAFMQDILQRYPGTIPLLFQKNAQGETYYDNLLMRHPNKISKGLEHVAFPVKTIRDTRLQEDGTRMDYYVNNQTNVSTWQRPY